jgi:tetratricopeptide (TPR) repeat protein
MPAQELKKMIAEAVRRKDFRLAERLCQEAERLVGPADVLLIRGIVYSAQGDGERAVSALGRAHQQHPERADIAYNYGVLLQQSGRIADAVEAWKKATIYAPQNVAVWVNLALATQQLGDATGALCVYREALSHHPTHRDLLYNYANLLFRSSKFDESERNYRAFLQSNGADAKAWINYGMLLKAVRRFAEAENCYRKAIVLGDQTSAALAHFNLGNLLLQQGRWQEGFAAYEWRLKLPGSIGNPWELRQWSPALPEGSSVLLWNDQGQGDAIMFLRFAPQLAERGYRLFALVQDSLKTIAATAPGIEAVFGPGDEPQIFNAGLPLCSLPHALQLEAIEGGQKPYLSVPDLSVMRLPQRTEATKRVGIVWAGNPSHANDAHRSMKLSDFAPLFAVSGVEWHSLQVGARAAELSSSPLRDYVRDLAPLLRDFSDTAAALKQCDLLISIDSAPAHLAGALGVPVWTLLPYIDCDWRWQASGRSTPWYPTMRLFRQPGIGDWTSVISEISEELQHIVSCGVRAKPDPLPI